MIYLDDPADFGVWGQIKIGQIPMFRTWLSVEHDISKLNAHQLFTKDLKHDEITQIYVGYGWLDIPALLKNIPDFIEPGSAVATVSNVSPLRSPGFCSNHQVYFQHKICPVCDDNIIHYGRRSLELHLYT